LLVTTASATQDIVIDAYRIDVLPADQLGNGSAVAIWGWHLGGTVIGGAGGLYLADAFGWHIAYQVLALAVLVGILAIRVSPEPARRSVQAVDEEEARTRARLSRHYQPQLAVLMARLHSD